jgi:hypothetical protein
VRCNAAHDIAIAIATRAAPAAMGLQPSRSTAAAHRSWRCWPTTPRWSSLMRRDRNPCPREGHQ